MVRRTLPQAGEVVAAQQQGLAGFHPPSLDGRAPTAPVRRLRVPRACLYAWLMPDSAVAAPSARGPRIRLPSPVRRVRPGTLLVPKWSVPAAMRALRATIVIPALFALTLEVIGDLQMAPFATFGGFATLVLASFGGTRRDKAVAHLGLALVGSAALVIGTLVSWNAFLAAAVTIPVAFAIFFAGVAGPNAAGGITAALLAYVLPVASAGDAATIPSRLAGWLLASVVCTLAVLLLSPRTPGDRLREAAAASAATLASHIEAAVRDEATQADLDRSIAAKHKLMDLFVAAPYRPTGLATADQGLANLAQELEWCTSLLTDALDGHLDLRRAAPTAICSPPPPPCSGTWPRCSAPAKSPTTTSPGTSTGCSRPGRPAPPINGRCRVTPRVSWPPRGTRYTLSRSRSWRGARRRTP